MIVRPEPAIRIGEQMQINGCVNDFTVIGYVREDALTYLLKSQRAVATFPIETRCPFDGTVEKVRFQCAVWNGTVSTAARILRGTKLYLRGSLVDKVLLPELPQLWNDKYLFVVSDWVVIDAEQTYREKQRLERIKAAAAKRGQKHAIPDL